MDTDKACDLDKVEQGRREAGRRELRVELERLECLAESPGLIESSGDESAGSYMSVESERGKRRRTHSSSDEEGRASVSSLKKKGRGRPPTTGQYIGLAQAKRELVEAQRLEMELQAEREVSELTRNLRTPRLSESSGSITPSPLRPFVSTYSLREKVKDAIETIMGVRNKSKNLSGPMMKALGDATAAIQESFERLLERTSTTEILALRKENTDLKRQMADLRGDFEVLKKELSAADLKARKLETELGLAQEQSAPSHPLPNMEEVIRRAVAEAVSVTNARMSARFEGLESRLLPAPQIRPPLAADKPKEKTPPAVQMPTPRAISEVCTLMPPANPAKTKAPKKGRNTKKKTKAAEAPPPMDKTSSGDGPWKTVTSKKKKKASDTIKEQPKKTKKPKAPQVKRGPPKLRAPQSSAVVLRLEPAAEERGVSYADVLLRAKEKIRFADLGIPVPQIKRSATGGRLLVLPGAATGEKADTLAKLLQENVGDIARVSRPTRCVGVRVSGLDDISSREDVIAAMAEAGSVPPEQIRCGEINRLADVGTVIVQCPMEAAKRLVDKGRLLVGWVSARIKLLDARPLRCFKCLGAGHTAAVCQSQVDRSGLCYRCGQAGHKAVACKEKSPNCALCAAEGRPASHGLGGGACAAPTRPRTRGGKSKKSGGGPRAPPPTSSPAQGVSSAAGAGQSLANAEKMVTDGCPTDSGSAGGAPQVGETSVAVSRRGPRVEGRGT